MIALLIFARVSNYSGRRPVALVTLGLAAIGCLVFLYLQNDSMFLVGRFIQGISCGLASSTISAYVVDTAPENPRWLGAAVTSGAVMIGLSVGVFGSGALKEIGPGSLTLIYGILIGLIAVCGLLIAAGPETMKPAPGMAASLVPQIRVPGNIRPLLLPASSTFIGVWAIGGFYQAFSSSMASDLLGTTNTIVAATVFASMMAPNAIGGALSGSSDGYFPTFWYGSILPLHFCDPHFVELWCHSTIPRSECRCGIGRGICIYREYASFAG